MAEVRIEDRWWTEEDGSDIVKLFDPKDISVDIRHMSIHMLLQMIERGEIDLLPAFQRRYDLWTDEAKSLLIESILLNFPIPPLFFDATSHDRWVVVDGLQRLWTLKHFVIEQEFKLKGISVLSNFNGLSFSSLEKQYQRKIQEYSLVIYVIRPGAPRYAIYDIFRRLNTGGLALNAQEIRHAMSRRASEFLDGLVKYRSFRTLISVKKRRMEHIELVLRFCSFAMHDYHNYRPSMATFLDRSMEELNVIESESLDNLAYKFKRSHDFISEVFGDQLFQKKGTYAGKKRFNKALYEVWTVLISTMDDSSLEKIKRSKESVILDFLYLCDEIAFNDAISVTTASRRAVLTRFGKIQDLLDKRSI